MLKRRPISNLLYKDEICTNNSSLLFCHVSGFFGSVSSSRSRPVSNSPPFSPSASPIPACSHAAAAPFGASCRSAGPPCYAHESAPVLHPRPSAAPLHPPPQLDTAPRPLPSLHARAWRGRLHGLRDGMSLHENETPSLRAVSCGPVRLTRLRVTPLLQLQPLPPSALRQTASLRRLWLLVAALEGDVRCQLADPCGGRHSPSKQPWRPGTAREAELKRPAKPLCLVFL